MQRRREKGEDNTIQSECVKLTAFLRRYFDSTHKELRQSMVEESEKKIGYVHPRNCQGGIIRHFEFVLEQFLLVLFDNFVQYPASEIAGLY